VEKRWYHPIRAWGDGKGVDVRKDSMVAIDLSSSLSSCAPVKKRGKWRSLSEGLEEANQQPGRKSGFHVSTVEHNQVLVSRSLQVEVKST